MENTGFARQLTLFEKTETEELREELSETKQTLGNLRRGLFKRNSTLAQEVQTLQTKIEIMQNQMYNLEKYIRMSEPKVVDSPREFLIF